MKTRQCFDKRWAVILLLTLMMASSAWSYDEQEFFYSYEGQKIHIDVATDRFVIQSAETIDEQEVRNRIQSRFPDSRIRQVPGGRTQGFYEVRLDRPMDDRAVLREQLQSLREEPIWRMVEPVYLHHGNPLTPYNVFVVRINDESVINELNRLNEEYEVELVSRNVLIPEIVTLRLATPSEHTITEIARMYYNRLELLI